MVLSLLQLASPGLPIGAYSYSEGLESLVEVGVINHQESLKQWLEQELCYGAIRQEAAVMVRGYRSVVNQDLHSLSYWNAWATAACATQELRSQSWQMGNSLLQLLLNVGHPNLKIDAETRGRGDAEKERCSSYSCGERRVNVVNESLWESEKTSLLISLEDLAEAVGIPCNYAIAFGIAAAYWQIALLEATLGYLHSWASNLITAGVKLIPLGQTVGQQLLFNLHPNLGSAAEEILILEDDALCNCGWGRALASMAHETQYTRLFRS
ncbi:MAG: urease accessory protein UreF [Symploca sp. SIO3E6]|nr:urease accessory protein UreF [Caldora sp. SIO3E6]